MSEINHEYEGDFQRALFGARDGFNERVVPGKFVYVLPLAGDHGIPVRSYTVGKAYVRANRVWIDVVLPVEIQRVQEVRA